MIKLRRSKIYNQMEINKLANLRRLHPEMNANLDWAMSHLEKLMSFKKHLIINDDFTYEEHENTKLYIELMQNENYEKLKELNFTIDEEN